MKDVVVGIYYAEDVKYFLMTEKGNSWRKRRRQQQALMRVTAYQTGFEGRLCNGIDLSCKNNLMGKFVEKDVDS